MAEDPEKRFHSIMDKLFSSPKSVPASSSSSRAESSRGKKRSNPESALALVEPRTSVDVAGVPQRSLAPAEPPLCRPWDRGDLMRRMSTFKSMTWFAKPQVVSAVNCARRGWINLDLDIIGCEACGARLLFSTPSSWSRQQVEKAAMVFSLKLDSGHKLQCPWINNACDERLAEFPPTPPPVLVDKFRERSYALMQLSALPVISSAAVKRMRSAQLEEFLRQSELLNHGNGSIGISQVESPQNDSDADSASLYNQALKLISLCGWEPRSLPYSVDCKDRTKQLVQEAETSDSLHIVSGQNTSITFHCSSANENRGVSEDFNEPSGLSAEPQSIVFDCKLCGASVGLWTFSTVPRPLELLRLIGYAEASSKNRLDSSNRNKDSEGGATVNSSLNGTLSCIDRPSNLNLTIAGGPPPTRQNFKATISLPIIGRNLRAKFSHDSDFRDRIFDDQEPQSEIQNKNLLLEFTGAAESIMDKQDSHPEAERTTKKKTTDLGQCSDAIGEQSSLLNSGSGEKCSSEMDVFGEGNHDFILDFPEESIRDIIQSLDQSNDFSVNEQNTGSANPRAQVTKLQSGSNAITGNESGVSDSDIQNLSSAQEKGEKIKYNGVQDPESSELAAGKRKRISDEAMEFDPTRQHRHFCPWIVSTKSGAAGWQQTLSALFREKEHSSPAEKSPPPTSVIKVDDPITSVRNLFRTPSAKRMKPSRGSI